MVIFIFIISFHFISFHFISIQFNSIPFNSIQFISFHFISFHFILMKDVHSLIANKNTFIIKIHLFPISVLVLPVGHLLSQSLTQAIHINHTPNHQQTKMPLQQTKVRGRRGHRTRSSQFML